MSALVPALLKVTLTSQLAASGWPHNRMQMKPDTSPEAITKMISALRGLAALDGILGLYAGEAVNNGNGSWTHALYGRYTTKEALQSYADSKEHMDVVINLVRPICSDTLALDFEAQADVQSDANAIGAVCLVALKPKDESNESDLVTALTGENNGVGAVDITLGKGYAPARAKGFTWGRVSTHVDKESMLASAKDFVDLCKGLVESYLVVAIDCSVPPTSKI